jgi:hypothetical protein
MPTTTTASKIGSVAKLIGVLARQIWRNLGEAQKPFLNKELRGLQGAKWTKQRAAADHFIDRRWVRLNAASADLRNAVAARSIAIERIAPQKALLFWYIWVGIFKHCHFFAENGVFCLKSPRLLATNGARWNWKKAGEIPVN